MSIVGKNIQRERENQGISQNSLAKKAGIAQSTLNAIERQTKSPSVDTVSLIAVALKVSVSYLLGEDERNFCLSAEEKKILEMYRQLTDAGKDYVYKTLVMAHATMKKCIEGKSAVFSAEGI